MRALAGVTLCLALAGAATADEPDDAVAIAHRHFEQARSLYDGGDFAGAVREFSAGYDLAPRAEFLLNLGQTYRKLGDLPRARAFYEKYLAATPETEPRRQQVKEIIAEITSDMTRLDPTAAPPPHATAPAAVAATVVATPAAPPEPVHHRSKLWWLVPVALVVLAGAAVGIYFAAAPRSYCGGGAIACLDLSRAP
jgi:tetratricopeptide (TPR) repeat protein